MSKHVTIDLVEPIQGHGPDIRQLVYRKPKYRDIALVGAPYNFVTPKNGEPMFVENNEAIDHYAQALLVEPKEFSLIESQLGVRDTFAVRSTIMGFFTQPDAGSGDTKNSPQT